MFDAKKALLTLVGRSFNSVEFRKAFENILFENIKDIPVEFRARDLFELAWNNKWLDEVGGVYTINIPLESVSTQVPLDDRENAKRLIDGWLK